MHMIDNLKIHLKSLRYTIWRLTKAWTPISYDNSVDIRDGCKPLPTSMIKRFYFLSVVTSKERIPQNLPMTGSETYKWYF